MIIILGPPGSGKGTQVKNLNNITKRPCFSAGDYLKIYSETHIEVKKIMETGNIIETDEVNEYLTTTGINFGENVIFDGFPRTKKQLDFFLNYSYIKEGKKIYIKNIIEKVFILNVPNEEIEKRLLNRHICNKCFVTYNGENFCCGNNTIRRIDDMAIETIHNRINNYYKNIPIIRDIYLQNNIKICEINGEKTINEVSRDILNNLNN
jgi:adenylate kinase